MTDFNPICESISLTFQCPDCSEEVTSGPLWVPTPNYAAENNEDSTSYEDYEVECEQCGRSFDVTIYNAMYGGCVEVEGVDDVTVEEQYAEEDDEYYDYQLYQATHSEISEVGHLFRKTIEADGRITTHCVRTVHAEQNAICQAARRGIALDGATLYCRMTPCRTCAMLIINCGIKRVVCERKYHSGTESEELFRQAGVQLEFFHDEIQQYDNQ